MRALRAESLRRNLLSLILLFGGAFPLRGQFAYVANSDDDTVSAIDTDTNTVVATIPVGEQPADIAITPDGARAWVANFNSRQFQSSTPVPMLW